MRPWETTGEACPLPGNAIDHSHVFVARSHSTESEPPMPAAEEPRSRGQDFGHRPLRSPAKRKRSRRRGGGCSARRSAAACGSSGCSLRARSGYPAAARRPKKSRPMSQREVRQREAGRQGATPGRRKLFRCRASSLSMMHKTAEGWGWGQLKTPTRSGEAGRARPARSILPGAGESVALSERRPRPVFPGRLNSLRRCRVGESGANPRSDLGSNANRKLSYPGNASRQSFLPVLVPLDEGFQAAGK